MTDITISHLTNRTADQLGTGVFDVLTEAVKLHLKEEFNGGKITGAEYATVYLGALQSVLQQSITFILSEQEASKKIELLDKQIEEAAERIDLVRAQTAQVYEDIAASQAKTNRDTALSNKQIAKIVKETEDQSYITTNLRPQELLKLQAEVSLIGEKEAETVAGVTRSDSESVQKIALMAAQTLGFKSDTKQKVLKQLIEGWSVAISVAGSGNTPTSFSSNTAIDNLVTSVLSDV